MTGGAGFVGATLVRRLVATGYQVRVLDNLSTGDAAHLAGEVGRNCASYDLARQMLGYAPSVTREVGIPRTWEWFQQEVFRDYQPSS